jgi:hypothetical protein
VALSPKSRVLLRSYLWSFLIVIAFDGVVRVLFGHSLFWLKMHMLDLNSKEQAQYMGILVFPIVVALVSVWLTGIQMRWRIRKDLGRKATSADLTSIDTWMKVNEIEERNEQHKPLNPD